MKAGIGRILAVFLSLLLGLPGAAQAEVVLDLFSKDDAAFIFQLSESSWTNRVAELTASDPALRAFEDAVTGRPGLAYLPVQDVALTIVPIYGNIGRPTSLTVGLAFDGDLGRASLLS